MQKVELWDTRSRPFLDMLTGDGLWQVVAFSPDGKMLATASWHGSITLRDSTRLGAEMRTLQGHSEMINKLVFSPDGRTLASESDDKTIKLWHVSSGAILRTFMSHSLLVACCLLTEWQDSSIRTSQFRSQTVGYAVGSSVGGAGDEEDVKSSLLSVKNRLLARWENRFLARWENSFLARWQDTSDSEKF
jgi:WD40 repeat protein